MNLRFYRYKLLTVAETYDVNPFSTYNTLMHLDTDKSHLSRQQWVGLEDE